jgi:hypothetical protein
LAGFFESFPQHRDVFLNLVRFADLGIVGVVTRVTARLIALFEDESTNPHGAQLICTTPDTTLLSSALGEEVLRRSQVWFTDRDSSGATTLYPLSDFKPRKGENTERRYLGGSYGAVPKVMAEEFVASTAMGKLAAVIVAD